MNQGYRDDLAAAQARIAELEAERSGAGGADVAALETEHAALVRSVPTRARVRLTTSLAIFVGVVATLSMLFLSSPYDHHPRLTVALQMITIAGMAFVAVTQWTARVMGLRAVALSERLLAAERARAAMDARVRVAEQTRVGSAEPALEEEEEEPAKRTSPTRR